VLGRPPSLTKGKLLRMRPSMTRPRSLALRTTGLVFSVSVSESDMAVSEMACLLAWMREETRAKTSFVGLRWFGEVLTVVPLFVRVARADSNQCFGCKKRRYQQAKKKRRLKERGVEEQEQKARPLAKMRIAGLISFFFCSISIV
jgi:hypothetical protein